MILLKTKEEIELIRDAGLLLGKTLAEVGRHIHPGVTTAYLDSIGEQFIRDNGAKPLCKGFEGFPSALDCVIELNGYVADSAYTFAVGEVSPEMRRLMKVTREALFIGLDQCKVANRVGDISHAVQMHCEKNGYAVVRELCGHGVGFKMHESPNVPNYGVKGTGPLLKEGMVIAVEPMVCMGSKNVKFSKEDGWTCRTKDGKPAAHYEHTVAITANGPEILTTFDFIENNK